MGNFGKILIGLCGVFLIGLAVALIISQNSDKPYNEVVKQEDVEDEATLTFISGTEYFLPRDSQGSTIVKLRDSKNNFINTSCFLVILYPNRTIYLSESEMLQDLTYGSYYLHWDVPDDRLGVYDQEVKCLVKNKNISSAKAFHVSNITNILIESNNNLNGTMKTILSAIDCEQEAYNGTCDMINSLSAKIDNISMSINSTIIMNTNFTSITEMVINLNRTTHLYYQVSAPDCIEGSKWEFSANITNEALQSLPYLNCTLTTNVFGTENIPYDWNKKTYYKLYNCSPLGITSWDIDCIRNI